MSKKADFDGKVVLVTGAGRGPGRAVARAFAANGAFVAANDITPVNLDLTHRQIQEEGGQAREYIADISKSMPAQIMLDQIVADWGRIDILVNCAAVHPQALILDFDEWHWHRVIDVNVNGALLLTQIAAKAMRTQGGGVIIHHTSESAAATITGQSVGIAAQVISRAGIAGLARVAAQELAQYNIRVHAVCSAGLARSGKEAYQPEENGYQALVELILFLSGQASAHLNGLVLDVPDHSTDELPIEGG